MDTVTLKNGEMEFEPLVRVVMASLQKLVQAKPSALPSVVALCHDSETQLPDDIATTCKQLSLIGGNADDGYYVHGPVCGILLAAVTGEGATVTLGSPLADKEVYNEQNDTSTC